MKTATFSLVLCLALASCSQPDNGPTTDGTIPKPPPEEIGTGGEPEEGTGEKPEPKEPVRIVATDKARAAAKQRGELKVQIMEIFKQVEQAETPSEAALEREEELIGLYTKHNQLEQLVAGEGLNARLLFELTRRQFPQGEYLQVHREFLQHRSYLRSLGEETVAMIDRLEAVGKEEDGGSGEAKVEDHLEKLKNTPQPEGVRRPVE